MAKKVALLAAVMVLSVFCQSPAVSQQQSADIRQLEFACSTGNATACHELGVRYRRGAGVARNDARAAMLFQTACQSGKAVSCYDLGVLYLAGEGVARDDARAAKLFQTACDGGNGDGCNNIAVLYERGQGVARDDLRAMKLYERACAAGSALGCTNFAERGRQRPTAAAERQGGSFATTSIAPGYRLVSLSPTDTSAWSKILEQALIDEASNWRWNTYEQGTIRRIELYNSPDETETVAKFIYDYRGMFTSNTGWAEISIRSGQLNCVRFHDFPDSCRPLRSSLPERIAAAKARLASTPGRLRVIPEISRECIRSEERRQPGSWAKRVVDVDPYIKGRLITEEYYVAGNLETVMIYQCNPIEYYITCIDSPKTLFRLQSGDIIRNRWDKSERISSGQCIATKI